MYHGQTHNREVIHVLGQNLARTCDKKEKVITKVYLEALTDVDSHISRTLRVKIAQLVNKELGTKLRLNEY